MRTDNLVNGYVIPNLLYELMFLEEEHGINIAKQDWSDPNQLDAIIHAFVLPRFQSFLPATKTVIRNTLEYLLATQDSSSAIWDTIWQASSAPIPVPEGEREFFVHCYKELFGTGSLPTPEVLADFQVNHSMQLANRLN